MKLISFSLTGSRDTGDIFKAVGSNVKVTDHIFQKCALFTSEDCLITSCNVM